MLVETIHHGAGAAGMLEVIYLPLERIHFLAHGLDLCPHFGLGRLHLAQLGVLLLHALFKVQG